MREFIADRLLWASSSLYWLADSFYGGSVWCKNSALALLARRRKSGAR